MPKPLAKAVSKTIALHGNAASFLNKFNADFQLKVASDKRKAFLTEDSPTLTQLKHAYSIADACLWIQSHLENLNDYCNVKEKMSAAIMESLALSIISKYHYLKTSELMLFFHEFKMGEYGELYGAVDPLKITSALKEFMKYRNTCLSAYESEKKSQELLKPIAGVVSREEFERLKKKAEKDPSSFEKLFGVIPNREVLKYWKAWLDPGKRSKVEEYLIEFNLKLKRSNGEM